MEKEPCDLKSQAHHELSQSTPSTPLYLQAIHILRAAFFAFLHVGKAHSSREKEKSQ